MEFQRLRIVGFKSFVDPIEFRIEPGLTGVVGPNGCGKSNVLEALRWVMGANSAKAMRASGMDEVIFSGSSDRPSRNHAEVTLSIDNTERLAPQPFTDDAVIEISRRIDRGAGSTYRVNGKVMRARDVQLLFADASTGANSPALVRQGQISELIAAKPQNRRRILEEAGGVSGLHSRRHEAELRLKAAETNLSRLDDIGSELQSQLNRLKREARHAEKYKRVAAEIRALQSALLYARWSEAKAALSAANEALAEADTAVETSGRSATRAQTDALAAVEKVKPAREEDAVAGAILHRLTLERDRLDMLERNAREAIERLANDLERIHADQAREAEVHGDGQAQIERLTADIASLEALIAKSPERGPELEAKLEQAEAARAEAGTEVERLAGRAAAIEAQIQAEATRQRELDNRRERLEAAIEKAQQDRKGLGDLDPSARDDLQAQVSKAIEQLKTRRTELEAAETRRSEARETEARATLDARRLEDRLNGLCAEARGLQQVTAGQDSDYAPVLQSIVAEAGFEVALAAALGDDLEASLDHDSPIHWAGAKAKMPKWPKGVQPLSEFVKAPAELSARLAWCGVVDAAQGSRLAKDLPTGARLVSSDGQLWRWDGLTARADAPKPAAARLEQRRRLDDLQVQIRALEPEVEQAAEALARAADALIEAEDAHRAAREPPRQIETKLNDLRPRLEAVERDLNQRQARAEALNETLTRLQSELESLESQPDAGTDVPGDEALETLRQDLQSARAEAETRRAAAAEARLERDAETREVEARTQRLQTARTDLERWQKRIEAATARIASLESDAERLAQEHTQAQATPTDIATKRDALADQMQAAETRRKAAADALAELETAAEAAEKQSRQTERDAAQARETRAGLAARSEAAIARLQEVDQHLREAAQMSPEALGQKLEQDAVATTSDVTGAESLLYGLEREREALGSVNLRAEEEADELRERLQAMQSERSDLTGAIAKLRDGIDELNAEGRDRLLKAFDIINDHFQTLFVALFGGGQAELKLVESDDPLEAGLEIFACPPGKRLSTMSLMSGGEQALTATALIFAVFLANPAPVCVLDEVDAPLDDANVDRFCVLLNEMRDRTDTRFIVITHNPVTMSRMDRLFGVTMPERGVSQLVSVDLGQAEALAAE